MKKLHIILHPNNPSRNSTQSTLKMAMTLLDSGPKLDWTRDNQIFLRYKKWRAKVELIFRSALSQATPEEKTSYLKYWMGDQGLPLIEKWETTGKLDYSNPNTTPTKEGGRSRPLSSGFKLETYWRLLEEEFKPKGNKLLSIIELWTQSNQGSKTLNEWLTYIHNLVEACNYGDSTDRIIRDVLIIGCESSIAKDKIIRRGETITLNEVIEILQTEASTNSTLDSFRRSRTSQYNKSNRSTMSHTIAGARNPRNLLTSRIPVLLQVLQVPKESASDVVNLTAENIYKNAEPRMLHVMDVASKVTTRNVVGKQVTFQEIILIERISLHPQET